MEARLGSKWALWNAVADYWDKRMGDKGDWNYKNIVSPTILALIREVKGQRVLDGGCGTGSLARALATNGATVVGVDFSPKMVDHALRREKEAPLGIDYHCIQIERLSSLMLDPFDVIISDFTMQDSENIDAIVVEMRKNLRPGGKLIAVEEHPFFTIFDDLHVTTKRKWVGEGCDVSDFREVLVRYHKFGKVEITWQKGLFTHTYHRTLEQYSNALSKNGLVIKTIVEPVPRGAVGEVEEVRVASKYPMFIFFEATPIDSVLLKQQP